MPIRRQDRHRYPANWKQLRKLVLERAENRCECRGECGNHRERRCEAPNGELITRERSAPWNWLLWTNWSTGEVEGVKGHHRPIRVVLTLAHLDRTPENADPENLRAMCQRCHLRYDRFQHGHNARETRRRKKAVGDLPGLGDA